MADEGTVCIIWWWQGVSQDFHGAKLVVYANGTWLINSIAKKIIFTCELSMLFYEIYLIVKVADEQYQKLNVFFK